MSVLTSDQETFAKRYAADTGLDLNVVRAQLLAEESSTAAISRQQSRYENWLNIGETGSARYDVSSVHWFSGPIAAADYSAQWALGKVAIPGFGKSAPGIRNIFTVGPDPQKEISAIQQSGWASGGYPSLVADYALVTANAPSGGSPEPFKGGGWNPANWPADLFPGLFGNSGAVTKALGDFTSLNFAAGIWKWLLAHLERLGLLIGGGLLIVMGIILLGRESGIPIPAPG